MRPVDDPGADLLAIGSPGQSLRVQLLGPYAGDALDPETRGWMSAAIHVEASPFSGTIRTILAAEDIAQYRNAAAEVAKHGRATLGGGRAAEITLVRIGQVVEVTVTPSGDDPDPYLRFSIVPATS
jgi:hypothetical protein